MAYFRVFCRAELIVDLCTKAVFANMKLLDLHNAEYGEYAPARSDQRRVA